MTSAPSDENFVRAALAVLNTDTVQGENLVTIKINPVTKGMLTTSTETINFTMVPIVPRDENYRHCMTFTGSDGKVYPWVATAAGEVLIEE